MATRNKALGGLFGNLLNRAPVKLGWLSAQEVDASLPELSASLLGAKGEVSGIALATRILDKYEFASPEDRLNYFRFLRDDLEIDLSALRDVVEEAGDSPDLAQLQSIQKLSEPPRQELLRRLNASPGGTERLVQMRTDLLKAIQEEPDLKAIDVDFRHLLKSWFNRGFLVMTPIDWNSPAELLEKIIAYEAVHAIDSWEDLRRRLAPEDRRCFAFFHPAMPSEPLIFVEVALTKGIATSIQDILSEDRTILETEQTDTAMFYSISNCQSGLAGISFGAFLIKQVAADLAQELGNLKTYCTLSPVPGFIKWLDNVAPELAARGREDVQEDDRSAFMAYAVEYLTNAKTSRNRPVDPVAKFHIGNGAALHGINWQADTSDAAKGRSAGIMVNYLYDLAKVEARHEAFAATGKIDASSAVLNHLRDLPTSSPTLAETS